MSKLKYLMSVIIFETCLRKASVCTRNSSLRNFLNFHIKLSCFRLGLKNSPALSIYNSYNKNHTIKDSNLIISILLKILNYKPQKSEIGIWLLDQLITHDILTDTHLCKTKAQYSHESRWSSSHLELTILWHRELKAEVMDRNTHVPKTSEEPQILRLIRPKGDWGLQRYPTLLVEYSFYGYK